jgi:hypothetical protein
MGCRIGNREQVFARRVCGPSLRGRRSDPG